MALQFFILILMSRNIELDAIGSFTIAVVVISFVELLRDFGLRLSTLEKKNLSQQESSNIFWLSAFWGVVSFIILNIFLQISVVFMGESTIVEIVQILSFALIFSGIQVQYGVEMARRGSLIPLGLTDLFAQFFAGVVGLYLILSDYGALSLYAQFLCGSVFLLLFRMIQSEWHPSLPRKTNSLQDLFKLSGTLGKVQVLTWAGNNVDTLILGLTSPSSLVSVYNRAYGFTLLPQQLLIDSLTNWIIPSSKSTEDRSEEKNTFYANAHKFISLAFVPAIFFLIIFSEDVIQVTLGAKWSQVTNVFQILCLAMIPNAYNNLLRWIYIIEGRSNLLLKMTIYSKIVTVVFLVIGGLVSISAVAGAVVVSNVITWILFSTTLAREKLNIKVQFLRREIVFFAVAFLLFRLF
jgi:PST family polysaccharide transporter